MKLMQIEQKILLVGTERNCRSIGYVLDFKDFVMIERLTLDNFQPYQNYQIYVCELKHKSKKLIAHKLLKTDLKIKFLDDICRIIDETYTREYNHILSGKQINTTPLVIKTEKKELHASLIKRISRGMKHPLCAAWHVVLRLKERLKRIINTIIQKIKKIHPVEGLRKRYAISAAKHYQQQKVNENYREYLCSLSPANLLLYVLNAPVNTNIKCSEIENNILVEKWGNLFGCCSLMTPFGNLLSDKTIDEVYNSTYARIIKLSALNCSYCLCDFSHVCNCYHKTNVQPQMKKWSTKPIPNVINLNFDDSCNLNPVVTVFM